LPEWSEKWQPQVALLSVAAGDAEGRSDAAVLQGRRLLRTDQNGWIELNTDGRCCGYEGLCLGDLQDRQSGWYLADQEPAPIAWIDVQNGLGEGPAMSTEVFGCVLPFAVGKIGGWIQDAHPQPCGARVVAVNIGNPYHHGISSGKTLALGGDNDGTLTVGKLGTVVADAQPFDEAEAATEPIDRLTHVGIGKLGYDHAGWHGSVHRWARIASILGGGGRG
jgi:hypothetical protein